MILKEFHHDDSATPFWNFVIQTFAYRYVSLNANLATEALPIVIIVASANTLIYTWLNGLGWQTASRLLSPIFLGWIFLSWLSSWVASILFNIKIPVVKILRVRGYALLFSLLNIITIILIPANLVGTIVSYAASLISLVADVLSVREAGEISTSRATAIVLLPLFAIGFIFLSLLVAIRLIGRQLSL